MFLFNRQKRLIFLKWLIAVIGLVFLIFLANCSSDKVEGLPDRVDFNYHIRPILSNNCYACHGPDPSTREADLRLDIFEEATARLKDGGYAIVPGKAHKSLLIERITAADSSFRMPPIDSKKSLSATEIALLKRWINQGAEYKEHWAFIKPLPPKLPSSMNKASTTLIIDHLLEVEQSRRNLRPVSEAMPAQLIRRLSYILTGLPPSPEQVQHFVKNASPETYEKTVDHYLASPHFGERWARHWMDVIRYSESQGHEEDAMIGGAWRYRDYLIRAFNADVAYDQLVLEHLAGDLMESPRYHPDAGFNESIIGTAFLCMGEAKSFPVNLKQEETERIHTMIDVTATAFQAMSVACARCHDHKFDPIPTSDYYAMYGMFAGTRITPWPASVPKDQREKLENLEAYKQDILNWVEQSAKRKVEAVPMKTSQALHTVPDSVYRIMGDFREGSWEGWSSDGWAFGSAPVQNEWVYEPLDSSIQWVKTGYASSRKLVPGISGALRSKNFVIEHDSLLIRARGKMGTMRVVAENYQPINDLLYGGMHKFLKDSSWQDYILPLTSATGFKAYIEFLPGVFQMQSHKLEPKDYIEIQHVIAFNGEKPEISPQDSTSQILTLSETQRDDWTKNYERLSNALYDSTHFIGLVKGDPVFNPIYIRGDFKQEGSDQIAHSFLSAIKAGPSVFPQDGRARLAWAKGVVDPENPLSARIMVNRLWHYVFGQGLVETMDNFGVQGKLPNHPELLDFLALRFIEEGWSMKKMIKHLVMSQAFRRSSRAVGANLSIDAQNIYLHHYPVRRLEAEAIRDGVLAASGRLDSTMYGQPVLVDYTPFLSSFKECCGPKESGPLDGAGRRSIYQMVQRNYINPLMVTFDVPLPFATVGRRNVSYTPAQSLSLMNDPFFHQQAQHWSETILQNEAPAERRIQDIYLRAFAREPSEIELSEALGFLKIQAQAYGFDKESDLKLWTDFCHSIINQKEFIHLL